MKRRPGPRGSTTPSPTSAGLRQGLRDHAVDGQNPFRTTVQKPWKHDYSVNTNKQWFQPWFKAVRNGFRPSTVGVVALGSTGLDWVDASIFPKGKLWKGQTTPKELLTL